VHVYENRMSIGGGTAARATQADAAPLAAIVQLANARNSTIHTAEFRFLPARLAFGAQYIDDEIFTSSGGGHTHTLW
jgi:hypothetical protein